MNPEIKSVQAGALQTAYLEAGPAGGHPVILLHGFPYDIHCFDEVVPILASQGLRCIVPYLRGYGPTRFLSGQSLRSGEQAALGADLLALMDALAIPQALLGGFDWGGRAACIVSAIRPERVLGLVSCGTAYNIQNIAGSGEPADPDAEHRYWYQYYFHSERGRRGLEQDRRALCEYIWRLWSPHWRFEEEDYSQTAGAFDNPDFVEVVIHSYRHRFGLVPGDPAYQSIENHLATQPAISVPTINLHGEDDQVDRARETDPCAGKFTASYRRKVLPGIGHNPPQEAPAEFANAILALR